MAQMTLKLINPAQKPPAAKNVIHTGLKGGNTLYLELTNGSGFDAHFVNSGDGEDFLVKIPKNLIDDKAAQSVSVARPWTFNGIYTPQDDPDPDDDKNYVVLRLTPPKKPGIAFKENATVTIALSNLAPTKKGAGTILVAYPFADLGLPMTGSDRLTILGKSLPNQKTLIGNDRALLFGLKVNDGPAENPVIKSNLPITPATAVENRLNLNFTFQSQPPAGGGSDPGLGQLVPDWDPLNRPTFRISFAYFNPNADLPKPLTLTDDIECNAKELTSAWNIKLSLDSTDPGIHSNDWWQIVRDPDANSPVWLVTPTNPNTHLFTGTTQGAHSPGPFLDLFFSHIYSGMPIDPNARRTLMYLETFNFPGFNDGIVDQTLFKEDSIDIKCFDGKIETVGGTTTLVLNWSTTGKVQHCSVSGDSTPQGAQSNGDYRKTIDLTNPLASSYSLTAVGDGEVARLTKTIPVSWSEGTLSSSLALSLPTAVDISPSGDTLYVVGNNVLNLLDSKTLLAQHLLQLPSGALVRNVVASSDGVNLYIASQPQIGTEGMINAYTTTLQPTGAPTISPGANDAANLYPMALSDDGTQLAISIAYPPGTAQRSVAGYAAGSLQPDPAGKSPVTLDTLRGIGLAFHGDRLFYPDKNGLGVLNRQSFAPKPGSPVSLGSGTEIEYAPGPMAVSPNGKSVAVLARGIINDARAFVLCLVDLETMKLSQRVQVDVGYGTAPPVPTTWVGFAQDGETLFVFGTDYSTNPPDTSKTIFCAYQPETLQPLPWSPMSVSKFYGNAVMAPDGSRIHITTLDTGTSLQGEVIQLVPSLPSPQ